MLYDVVIVGGGPVGLAFAASLRTLSLKVLLVEKSSLDVISNAQDDGREIALTHASVKILKELGAWQLITPENITPISEAQVFNGNDHKNGLIFKAESAHLDALGYLVANHLIKKALFSLVRAEENITLLTEVTLDKISQKNSENILLLDNGEEVHAKLLVAADSRFSRVREQMGIAATIENFSKTMIITRAQSTTTHHNIAREYFNYQKTLALLPIAHHHGSACYYSVILTVNTGELDEVMALSDNQFAHYINTMLQNKMGKMKCIDKRYTYALQGVFARRFIARRLALIGDAAVAMHPVTAHGFNLGLRGQNLLAKSVIKAYRRRQDVGNYSLLKSYEYRQMPLAKLMYMGTNGVVSLFTNDTPFIKPVRYLMLKFAKHFSPIHRAITYHLTQSRSY